MSSATLRILENGDGDLLIEVESDPPLPFVDGVLDVDALTTSQAAALHAAQAIGEAGDGPFSVTRMTE